MPPDEPTNAIPQPTPTTAAEPEPKSLIGGAQDESKPGEPAEPPKAEEPKPFALDQVKLPEGFQIDAELGNEFVSLANEIKLTPEAAQKLVDLQAKTLTKLASEMGSKAFDQTKEQWDQQLAADPEFSGPNRKQVEANIARTLKVVGGKNEEKIRQAFDLTGAGSHPDIVRFMRDVAKIVNESKFVSGSPASLSSTPRSLEERLYPAEGKT